MVAQELSAGLIIKLADQKSEQKKTERERAVLLHHSYRLFGTQCDGQKRPTPRQKNRGSAAEQGSSVAMTARQKQADWTARDENAP